MLESCYVVTSTPQYKLLRMKILKAFSLVLSLLTCHKSVLSVHKKVQQNRLQVVITDYYKISGLFCSLCDNCHLSSAFTGIEPVPEYMVYRYRTCTIIIFSCTWTWWEKAYAIGSMLPGFHMVLEHSYCLYLFVSPHRSPSNKVVALETCFPSPSIQRAIS